MANYHQIPGELAATAAMELLPPEDFARCTKAFAVQGLGFNL